MTLQGQLAWSSHSAYGQTVPPLDFVSPLYANMGLLGNAAIQMRPVPTQDVDHVIEMYQRLFSGAGPILRLALLKRRRFTQTGQQARIQASLSALNATQPTELTLAQWKALLEEIEDED